MSKQRLFGCAENALVNISMQHHGYMRVGVVLHLQGPHISLEILHEAVALLQGRHPFLRSRLQNNPNASNTYLMEEDSTLHLKIRQIVRKRDDHLNFWRQEWQEREKDVPVVGEGLIEFWLFQDPNDNEVEDAPREIIIVCGHSICDGLSLSTVAHELLLALSSEDKNLFDHSLDWPLTIEKAVECLSTSNEDTPKVPDKSPVITQTMGRIPLSIIDFPLEDITKKCHTEASYDSLNMNETKKLFEKCRHENVTVTSAISSAILCAASVLVNGTGDKETTQLGLALATDSRRRCIPPVPNYSLSYHVSAMQQFTMSQNETPTTAEDMWKLAKTFGEHLRTCINSGQILMIGKIMGMLYQKSMGPINLSEAPTIGLSNWGLLPFKEHYGKWKLKTMLPMINLIRVVIPMVLTQTVNGILTIAYLGPAPLISPSILKNLNDITIQNLRQMII